MELPPSSTEGSAAKEDARADPEKKTEDAFEKLLSSESGTKQVMGMMMKMFSELLNQQTETMKTMTRFNLGIITRKGLNSTSSTSR